MNSLAIAWEEGFQDRLNPDPNEYRISGSDVMFRAWCTGYADADEWYLGREELPNNPYYDPEED